MEMHPRYQKEAIANIWADANKLNLWQTVELTVLHARVLLHRLEQKTYEEIEKTLKANPIRLDVWKKNDKEMHHDLNAFLAERREFLPLHFQHLFHQGMTSYDTEEPAFGIMLITTSGIVKERLRDLMQTVKEMAQKYRHTLMLARSHGQEAKLQSFGKRCLTWYQDLGCCLAQIEKAEENLTFSKLSGAIGNYGDLDPELEEAALKLLGFKPYYGATQIMPRVIYTPLAAALCQTTMLTHKIALDIRLGARSGLPLFQEPFGAKQKGSSAMPHKKNTITAEQMEGMARMALGYLTMIMSNIPTWEERAIEQSCVERVAWPDLFHVTVHSLEAINTRVLKKLTVLPDNMLEEIVRSRGCYASDEAKNVLAEILEPHKVTAEDVYRIIQLACFNLFEPNELRKAMRDDIATTMNEMSRQANDRDINRQLTTFMPGHLRGIITGGALRVSPQLAIDASEVEKWNTLLRHTFSTPANKPNNDRWEKIFRPSYLLRHEPILFQRVLGV